VIVSAEAVALEKARATAASSVRYMQFIEVDLRSSGTARTRPYEAPE